MTREEVAEIINYCQTNQVTYKARLQELGIPTWKFYDAKAKYAEEEVYENAQGAFVSSNFVVSIRRNAYCSGERSSLLLQKIEIL